MGAVNSCCIPKHSGSDFEAPKGGRGHRRNLSATFNMAAPEEDKLVDAVDINFATEEELMTLPMINRQTAQNIIEYRRQIGGFKKVEDLALVSGVGASKLNAIRNEIYVNRQTPWGNSSSGDNSLSGSKQDLLLATPNGSKGISRNSSFVKVNVNTANVFELTRVKGIGQTLADNIVTYRDKKGPFQTLDDLTKVKGIGQGVLGAIKSQLTLEDTVGHTTPPSSNRADSKNSNTDAHSDSNHVNTRTNHVPNSNQDPHRAMTASVENILDIIQPIAKNSKRPSYTPFNFKRKNRKAVRLASWNVERFSSEKAENIGVKEVICLTILENGISIVAFQELADQEALKKVCDELNNPTVPSVKKFSGHRGSWKYAVSQSAGRMYQSNEYNGFLFDTSQKIELKSSALLERPKNKSKPFARQPFVGVFKVNKLDFVMVSVHLKATGLGNEDLAKLQLEIDKVPHVVRAIEEHYPGERDIFIVGDFNLDPEEKDFDELRERQYSNCIPKGLFTNISNNNPKGSRTYDHIWISEQSAQVFTGHSGVVREGLTSPWIPNGWSWGGVISDHCPVWAEFYTSQDLDTADLNIPADKIKFALGD